MTAHRDDWRQAALDPRAIAVIGASDNPNKVGGRPLAYLKKFGFKGTVFPINPQRDTVQGHRAFARLADLPAAPDLAVIAVPADAAPAAVEECAAAGVRVAVVITSGFAETGAEGRAIQDEMVATARARGMRLVGPNTQGIANFGTGAVASFATMFSEVPAADGPVAIVSQSGAMSVVPYAYLRARGLGVRHSHATGNEADLTVADFALATLDDPATRLLLLYLETIADPAKLELVAARARARDVPVLALKSGRSARGAAAAASHTGALASEDRVIDAFLRQQGILRVDDMHALVNAAEIHLLGLRPRGRRLAAISNSGASCVMAADLAETHGLDLRPFDEPTRAAIAAKLPAFANAANPIDLTGALLSNSGLFSDVLPILAARDSADLVLIALPNAGAGYDVDTFARDAAAFMRETGRPVAVTVPHQSVADRFRAVGLPTYAYDRDAIAALAQSAHAAELLRRSPAPMPTLPRVTLPAASTRFLSEWDSLALIAAHRIPVPRMHRIRDPRDAQAALAAVGGRAAVKACSAAIPHKSEHGLVKLGIHDAGALAAILPAMEAAVGRLGVAWEGAIVAEMIRPRHEFMLGARHDPVFGTLVLVGDGGKYVEALKDTALLRFPFTADDARAALAGLRIAPVFAGVRGEPPLDFAPLAAMAVALGAIVAGAQGAIASIDINPVIATEDGRFIAADALVEQGARP